MTKMNLFSLIFVVGVALALDLVPTNVVQPQYKTLAPSDKGDHVKYVQTVYKATDKQQMIHTVEPLQPSYEVLYHTTPVTTINNQTIGKTSLEFATVLNTTISYSQAIINGTFDVASTNYQTMDFTSQEIVYTPITGNTTQVVTVTETNILPFV